jgi:hypothetical protein
MGVVGVGDGSPLGSKSSGGGVTGTRGLSLGLSVRGVGEEDKEVAEEDLGVFGVLGFDSKDCLCFRDGALGVGPATIYQSSTGRVLGSLIGTESLLEIIIPF